MLEVGWSEILVIALILIIVVGPKDLPQMLRTFGRMANRLRGMANEFKGQFDDALREADLDDVRKGLSEVNKLNPTNSLRDAMNPIRKLGEDIKSDLKKASDMSTPSAATAAEPATPSAIEPIADPLVPPAIEKIAEPAPLAQPPLAQPSSAAAMASKIEQPVVSSSSTAVSEPVATDANTPNGRKAPLRIKDAAVAAVAAEAAAKKPASRKKPALVEQADDSVTADAKPKRAAPRKKIEKAGDA